MPIPPLTWVRCECGCGFEGPDPVGDFLLVEAALIAIEGEELVAKIAAQRERELTDEAARLRDELRREGW